MITSIMNMMTMKVVLKDAELSHLLRLISGVRLGIIPCQLNPVDLLQGWLTVQTDKSSSQCLGIAHALRSVLREDPRALYKGWSPYVVFSLTSYGAHYLTKQDLDHNNHMRLERNSFWKFCTVKSPNWLNFDQWRSVSSRPCDLDGTSNDGRDSTQTILKMCFFNF
ncbi:Mitochondrial carrier domain-containing protein [Artemisia annua]|uniref:Mitochondrial carrier domain-containing protein n=1 Tax=Artemisia annua TaxID=35608 RepID=A0A2U1LLZ7_ARTAN|nr:Mitochondrial carrier domain-containing protein [Artemisia annua]